jgi:hypothetical protein
MSRSALPFSGRWQQRPKPALDATPGPIYSPRSSSMHQQVIGFGRPTAPSYSFGGGADGTSTCATQLRDADAGGGPGTYSPRVTRHGTLRTADHRLGAASGSRSLRTRPQTCIGRLQLGDDQVDSVGPAGYTLSLDAIKPRSPGIKLPPSTGGGAGPESGRASPRAPFYSPSKTRFGGSSIGEGRAGFSMASRDVSPRYLSKEHAAQMKV